MLSVERLQKTYSTGGKPLEVLRDVSFTVKEGEFVTVVGPSGAGKTTLLRCMAGLLPPSGGKVTLTDTGRVIDSPPKEIACVFQDYSRSLMPWYKVSRNVALPLANTIKDRDERRQAVEQALQSVGLDGFGDSYPWQLSGGMQQRVAIARALAYRPEFLIMDEPFASVDAQTRADLEDLILRVRQSAGVTIVLVTHDIDEAVYLADRVVVVSNRPTVVMDVIDIDLPHPRSQVTTKGLPRFGELRTKVAKLITQASADAAAAQAEAAAAQAEAKA
ncbi:ABC transporter ATP-binding protein [Arthrobacter sp. CDRTa11]|uniref:ABC transporter ATP-binding protein n=1 Tax=Arthrobacter sp. CDRTa11 TaxID=2651199 RepID=UPI002265AA2B|nr:ABC transporter ATP-binding protein [Arthrobacter sp. CDRTa11]UZX03114.1 ABC transporter ATP-binding protein [Arthrobacter sp. CDRTa11]